MIGASDVTPQSLFHPLDSRSRLFFFRILSFSIEREIFISHSTNANARHTTTMFAISQCTADSRPTTPATESPRKTRHNDFDQTQSNRSPSLGRCRDYYRLVTRFLPNVAHRKRPQLEIHRTWEQLQMIDRPRERSNSRRHSEKRSTRIKCVLASSMTPPVVDHDGSLHVRCVRNINKSSDAVQTKQKRSASSP